MCLFKLDLLLKELLHWLQENGFSPVCNRKWLCKPSFLRNVFPHLVQTNAKSPKIEKSSENVFHICYI